MITWIIITFSVFYSILQYYTDLSESTAYVQEETTPKVSRMQRGTTKRMLICFTMVLLLNRYVKFTHCKLKHLRNGKHLNV